MTNTIFAQLSKSEGHPFCRSCFTALADCKQRWLKVYVLTNESGPSFQQNGSKGNLKTREQTVTSDCGETKWKYCKSYTMWAGTNPNPSLNTWIVLKTVQSFSHFWDYIKWHHVLFQLLFQNFFYVGISSMALERELLYKTICTSLFLASLLAKIINSNAPRVRQGGKYYFIQNLLTNSNSVQGAIGNNLNI